MKASWIKLLAGMSAPLLMFAAFGCGDNSSGSGSTNTTSAGGGQAPATASSDTLSGAGSTFIAPIMSHWTDEYKKESGLAINYQPNGSGGGIRDLTDHTVSFAGSDAPMSAEETAKAKDPVLHIPDIIGTVCIAYNVQGLQPGIHLTGPVIANIFMGKITSWDDPQIASLNPGVNLPKAAIFIAHRSEGSGTTYIFTDYLSKVSPDWKDKVGTGKSVTWPAGLGGKGSAGVSALLQTHPNSIGYVELTYAQQNKIPYAAVQNSAGQFVLPSAESGSAAVEGATIPDDMKASVTNTANPKGYPITGFSWLIVYQSSPRTQDLKKFLTWVLEKGQNDAKPLGYAAIPDSLKKRELALIDSMK